LTSGGEEMEPRVNGGGNERWNVSWLNSLSKETKKNTRWGHAEG